MTGHFPARYNIDGHFAWVPQNRKRNMPDWLSPQAPLLPRFLQQAGYATAHFGKWHLANDMIPDSPLPGAYGYDEYGAFNCAGEQMPVHEDADNAIAFIEKSHRASKPFFITYGFTSRIRRFTPCRNTSGGSATWRAVRMRSTPRSCHTPMTASATCSTRWTG